MTRPRAYHPWRGLSIPLHPPLGRQREPSVQEEAAPYSCFSFCVYERVPGRGKAAARRGSTRSRQLEKQKVSATCSTRCLTHPLSHCFGTKVKQTVVVVSKKGLVCTMRRSSKWLTRRTGSKPFKEEQFINTGGKPPELCLGSPPAKSWNTSANTSRV